MGFLGVGITAVELHAIPKGMIRYEHFILNVYHDDLTRFHIFTDTPHRDAVIGITSFEIFLYSLLSLGLAFLLHGIYTVRKNHRRVLPSLGIHQAVHPSHRLCT